ncbi:13889_t:CDS:2, partial [Funneliformis geosporum]
IDNNASDEIIRLIQNINEICNNRMDVFKSYSYLQTIPHHTSQPIRSKVQSSLTTISDSESDDSNLDNDNVQENNSVYDNFITAKELMQKNTKRLLQEFNLTI